MKQFIKDYQFLIFAAVQIGWGIAVWWFNKNIATKEDVAKVQKNVEGVGGRVSTLEVFQRSAPDRQDLALLHLEMERTRGQINTFTAELRGAQATMSAQIEGARDLNTRVENTARMLLEHALENGQK